MQDHTEDPSLGRQPDSVIGTPGQDAQAFDGQQTFDDTCAIRCQEFILEQFQPGVEYDESELRQEAYNLGWYAPGQGTSPEDMGNILELHGIPVNHYEDATAYDLANELAQGHKVMISVDSGELWDNSIKEQIADLGVDDGPDHAVVVSGIDASDPDNPKVIISDSGTGEPAARYPMDQFLGAWEDGNFQMVSTQGPAPSSVPGMQNFDYGAGHIPQVGGMPYDQFVTAYEQDPETFGSYLDQTVQLSGGWSDGSSAQGGESDNSTTDTGVDTPQPEWPDDQPAEDPEIEEWEDQQANTWAESFEDPYNDY